MHLDMYSDLTELNFDSSMIGLLFVGLFFTIVKHVAYQETISYF